MYPLIGQCPVCGDDLTVVRLHCRNCDTSLEGQFSLGRLSQLSPEQVTFVETFVRCEGKIKRVEEELGVSYPTVRSRLDEIIQALGYEVDSLEKAAAVDENRRQAILQDLAQGHISSEQAVALLRDL